MKKIVTGVITLACAGFLFINDSSASVNASNNPAFATTNAQAFIQDTGTHKKDSTMKKKWKNSGKPKKDSTQLKP